MCRCELAPLPGPAMPSCQSLSLTGQTRPESKSSWAFHHGGTVPHSNAHHNGIVMGFRLTMGPLGVSMKDVCFQKGLTEQGRLTLNV